MKRATLTAVLVAAACAPTPPVVSTSTTRIEYAPSERIELPVSQTDAAKRLGDAFAKNGLTVVRADGGTLTTAIVQSQTNSVSGSGSVVVSVADYFYRGVVIGNADQAAITLGLWVRWQTMGARGESVPGGGESLVASSCLNDNGCAALHARLKAIAGSISR